MTPLIGGLDSQTFRFRRGGRDFVLRLNPSPSGFEKDALAARCFACAGLPIPPVLEIGRQDDLYYCVTAHMPGRTLQELSPAAVAATLEPSLQVLRHLAAQDLGFVTGFGPFTAAGRAPYATWREFLLEPLDHSWPDPDAVKPLLDRLRHLAPHCPEVHGLIHGDFGSNNVLALGSRITALLDWSEAAAGDPLYDVANVLFWRTWLPCMEQLASYLETAMPGWRSLHDRLLCYQLRIGLEEILHAPGHLDSWAWQRCRQLLALSYS